MPEEYYAHYRPDDDVYQTLETHYRNTAGLAEDYCPVTLLKAAAWLAAMLHDNGKFPREWQLYFKEAVRNGDRTGREKMDHSTMGGLIMESLMPKKTLTAMVQIAIYMHHGLQDCVSTHDLIPLVCKREQKASDEAIQEVQELYFPQVSEDVFRKKTKAAKAELGVLLRQIKLLPLGRDGKSVFGNGDFYLGMCERLLLSALIDADWRDTADFMDALPTGCGLSQEETQLIWEKAIGSLEAHLEKFDESGRVNLCRKQISDQCRDAAGKSCSLFRLAVPTGAGKTLSGLRFALYCASKKHKKHIFYIAPYRSILEQNAEEIRKSIGMPEMVLEHHSDVILDDEKEYEKYERLIENWDELPVIVTTAVQFFNTLYKEKRSSVRRFHSLCNSVILIDEVQAIPVKLLELFNMAVNFLTQICGSTVVLCTATQPLLDELRQNRMLPAENMTEDLSFYGQAFRRVEFHDCTAEMAGGFDLECAADFVLEKAEEFDQLLVIVNTKACAKKLYESLSDRTDFNLYHLSTFMCPEHRSARLKEIKAALTNEKKVICISTQLVEAGVDFSFQCVIRSLAGLDNLIQAAGRCNRNGLPDLGHVYLIRMNEETEHISGVPDIKKAQEAMLSLLSAYGKNPESFGNRLDSKKAVDVYYRLYFYSRQDEMRYPVKIDGVSTDIVELLSANTDFPEAEKGVCLKQAFRSAGEAFQVIEENGGRDIVVPYGNYMEPLNGLQQAEDREDRKRAMRQLQRYTVSLPEHMIRRLGNAVSGAADDRVLVLADGYYDDNTGVLM